MPWGPQDTWKHQRTKVIGVLPLSQCTDKPCRLWVNIWLSFYRSRWWLCTTQRQSSNRRSSRRQKGQQSPSEPAVEATWATQPAFFTPSYFRVNFPFQRSQCRPSKPGLLNRSYSHPTDWWPCVTWQSADLTRISWTLSVKNHENIQLLNSLDLNRIIKL